jgi:hypothetical protein
VLTHVEDHKPHKVDMDIVTGRLAILLPMGDLQLERFCYNHANHSENGEGEMK